VEISCKDTFTSFLITYIIKDSGVRENPTAKARLYLKMDLYSKDGFSKEFALGQIVFTWWNQEHTIEAKLKIINIMAKVYWRIMISICTKGNGKKIYQMGSADSNLEKDKFTKEILRTEWNVVKEFTLGVALNIIRSMKAALAKINCQEKGWSKS
jgi:hypothetical protein